MTCGHYVISVDFTRPIEAVIPGAQGRVLAVLAETTAELNLRTVARLADVSVAQASRVLPGLVELGLVERREVPPSSLFVLNRRHLAAAAVLQLARARETTLETMGTAAAGLDPLPVSVIVFGSFARREADEESDIDVVMVRRDEIDQEDGAWLAAVEGWAESVRDLTGNRVEVVDVDRREAQRKLAGRASLWRDIAKDGVVVYGETIEQLQGLTVA